MNPKPEANKPNIFPSFRYTDAPKIMDWLENAFGFERHFVIPGPEGRIAHAQLKLGAGVVMIGSENPSPDPSKPWEVARYGTYVYVPEAEIEAHYAQAQAAGANLVHKLHDTEYGSREYSAYDPEGNLWSFGTYQPTDSPA